jgi:hypothetical protein
MKIRNGFVSNSSSSSFLVFSKQKTLYDALKEGFDEIFAIPDVEERSPSERFCNQMKPFWLEQLSNGEYNDFWSNEMVNADCPESVVNVVSSEEEWTKYVDDKLTDDVKELFASGWNCFMLDVPDGGDGGSLLQNISRHFVRPLKGETIIIRDY